jgi:cytochrome c oxidase subunit 2
MMMVRKAAGALVAVAVAMLAMAETALAQAGFGAPTPWQMNFQEPATPVMADVVTFHNFLTVLITLISLFVLSLLLYIIWRFNAKANPVPSKNSHNTMLEVVWTVIPIAILVIMAIPSFRLLYKMDVVPDAAKVREWYPDVQVAGTLDIKAIGNQWFWSYEYPNERIQFDAFCGVGPIEGACFEQTATEQRPRLLETTEHVVVPVNTLVRLLTVGNDVIHAWAMPAFGVKIDAVPGRTNESWFLPTREGVYFGQCSELCGQGHGYMPITVEVVSQQRYNEWLTSKRAEMAVKDGVKFAAN